MEILGRLFGSPARVKIIRLFVFNPRIVYELTDIVKRTKVPEKIVRAEIVGLRSAGLIKTKTFYKDVIEKRGKSKVVVRRRVKGIVLEEKFPYLQALSSFLINASPVKETDVLKRLSGVGKLKFVAIAGIFLKDFESRLDILVVGDKLKRRLLERAIRRLESEIGREIRFAVFSSNDFKYRLSVYDRLIRDVLDYPHLAVVDRFGITESSK